MHSRLINHEALERSNWLTAQVDPKVQDPAQPIIRSPSESAGTRWFYKHTTCKGLE